MEAQIIEKQLVIIGIVTILVCVSLNGCTSTPSPPNNNSTSPIQEKTIIGKWKVTHYTNKSETFGPISYYTFYNNGSIYSSDSWNITYWANYILTDNELLFTYSDGSQMTYDYSFSNNNQKLKITDTTKVTGGYYHILERQ
jgi:hypothetical protein